MNKINILTKEEVLFLHLRDHLWILSVKGLLDVVLIPAHEGMESNTPLRVVLKTPSQTETEQPEGF